MRTEHVAGEGRRGPRRPIAQRSASQDRHMSRAYALIFDDYADWELGHVLAELRRYGKVEVVTVGFSEKAVTSMGGLRIIPDMSINDIDIHDVLVE